MTKQKNLAYDFEMKIHNISEWLKLNNKVNNMPLTGTFYMKGRTL